jgi:hypothetical protein
MRFYMRKNSAYSHKSYAKFHYNKKENFVAMLQDLQKDPYYKYEEIPLSCMKKLWPKKDYEWWLTAVFYDY